MRLKVVACGVFEPELRRLAAESVNDVDVHLLDAGLHENPDELRTRLQEAIDEADDKGYDAVVAGYGLCGRGTGGIVARRLPVVLLRVHDCVTLFLGSREAYMQQFRRHPGTFYITPGWYEKKIASPGSRPRRLDAAEASADPRFLHWARQFGDDGAHYLLSFYDSWKRNYTRAAYVDTVAGTSDDYERYARDMAEAFGWEYERLEGDTSILRRALDGEWDSEDMLVLQPTQRSAVSTDGRLLVAVDASTKLADHPPEDDGLTSLVVEPDEITAIGIDAGGTYTDCVVYDFAQKRLLAKAKALTTRHDLMIGIEAALDALPELSTERIGMVALSTTLATNSVVEDRGGRPGVILMAPFDPEPGAIRWPLVRRVTGAMSISGEETMPLDLQQVEAVVRELLAEGVDAFVVSGYGAVRNPAHENAVRAVIERHSSLPVICGHHLSTQLDYVTRANTAILNGRLLSVIEQLLSAVRAALAKRGINAPLMIVKGDGSLINESVARQRPVETVLSGPAASVVGARFLTRLTDGLVLDMGGTTTDAAEIIGGLPQVHPRGATVGGWRTCVEAADIVTVGLGGDSYVSFNSERRLTVGPRRAVPLCYIAAHSERAASQLMALHADAIIDRSSGAGLDFFMLLSRPADQSRLPDRDRRVIDALDEGPLSRAALAMRLGLASPTLVRADALEAAGHVIRGGLTPTDVLHVRGQFQAWDTTAARHALQVFADLYGASPDDMAAAIVDQVVRRLCLQVLISAYKLPPHDPFECDCALCRILVDSGLSEGNGHAVEVDLRYLRDIVAIGAPVGAFFPEVARRLRGKLTIPEHAEVANAIGAIASEVIVNEAVVVRPGEIGNFIVHGRGGRTEYPELEEAISAGRAMAERLATQRALAAGAGNPAARTEIDRRTVRIADGSLQLVEVRISTTAAGRPTLTPVARAD
jgi:N-methylhydantoinase A/oxoprolinase/acetone carboxylase beta subunit